MRKKTMYSGNPSASRSGLHLRGVGRLLDGDERDAAFLADPGEQAVRIGRFDDDGHLRRRKVLGDHGVGQLAAALVPAEMEEEDGDASLRGLGDEPLDARLLLGRVDPGCPEALQTGPDDDAQRLRSA
jgi:hypothetical protein